MEDILYSSNLANIFLACSTVTPLASSKHLSYFDLVAGTYLV